MEHQRKLPLLTLKHGAHSPEHHAEPLVQPQPQYMLKRRHSKTKCAVYVKHPRRPAYLGTSAKPGHGAERTQYGARSGAEKARQRAQPRSHRQEPAKT